MSISYEDLRDAVGGVGVGLRARTHLEPLGGPGDKIFPATYGEDGRGTKYAFEGRKVEGTVVNSVVLDSVSSQANRFELALLEAYRDGDLDLPVVSVDFRDVDDLAGFDRITSLEAPHRIFDAILRDSLLGDQLFRLSEVGQAITEASTKNAAALFHYSPTTLLFGGWDSTGPKGGRGAKYERAVTSEIVGLGVEPGVKTSSRLDPLAIERKGGRIYEAGDDLGWTLDLEQATLDEKDKPKLFARGAAGEAGTPAKLNHGNIPPSVDVKAGGVTVDEIVATTVLSFAQLRRLRFPVDTRGTVLDGEARKAAEVAARTALAALGLVAAVLAFDEGFDLRSRCVLVARGDLSFELLRRGNLEDTTFTLNRDEALGLLASALEAVEAAGIGWHSEEILLSPADRLSELVRRSQALAAASSEDEGE